MKDKIDIKINSWKEVSINKYYEIVDIFNDESKDEFAKYMSLLAILCEVDEDVVYNLQIQEARKMFAQIAWINDFSFLEKPNSIGAIKHINIDDKKYNVVVDMKKFTVSQYVDFQTFWHKKDLEKYYGNIMAIFILPEGKQYGEGYDVTELAEYFRDKISIVTANQVCFFFLNSLAISIMGLVIYLAWMKRRNKKMKNLEELQKNIEMIQDNILHGYQ